MSWRASKRAMLVAISSAVIVLAVSGCGDGDDTTDAGGTGTAERTGDTERTGDAGQEESEQVSGEPVGTQPATPCEPVPDGLVEQIVKGLNPDIKVVASVWQMVQSDGSYPQGLKDPLLVSASLEVEKNPPAVATWAAGDPSGDPVIPLDGVAKSVTVPEEEIDPTKYSDLIEEKDYVTSRECAQQAYGLQEQEREQEKQAEGSEDESESQESGGESSEVSGTE